MTPEELKAERAALELAIEQRQHQIDREETLAWCEERKEPRCYVDYTREEPVVTKSVKG